MQNPKKFVGAHNDVVDLKNTEALNDADSFGENNFAPLYASKSTSDISTDD